MKGSEDKMQLPTATYQVGVIECDFTEIKKELEVELKKYNVKVTADDIDSAKSMRANLNKAKKVIDDERKRIKKEYCYPLEKFESDVKELTKMIDETSKKIDVQVKEYEQYEKEQKANYIYQWWQGNATYNNGYVLPVPYEMFYNAKWLNKTCTEDIWQNEIKAGFSKIKRDKEFMDLFCVGLSDSEKRQVVDEYCRTFDVGMAKAKADYIERIKEEELARKRMAETVKQEKEEKTTVEQPKQEFVAKEEPKQNTDMLREFVISGERQMFVEIANVIRKYNGTIHYVNKDEENIKEKLNAR